MKINQFKVGDIVTMKGKKYPMKITSNIPGGGINIKEYLATDKYRCEWEKNGKIEIGIFSGDEIEPFDNYSS